jgi:hypothetical protein
MTDPQEADPTLLKHVMLAHLREHRPDEWRNATVEDVDRWCAEQADEMNRATPGEDPVTAEDMLANAFDNHQVDRDTCEACDL